MIQPVFRFAPSPNGELHLGHAYSALLNAEMAAQQGGRFLLRIEDIDSFRCTAALTRQALEDLAWLELQWEQPIRIQSRHLADYTEAQRRLNDLGLLYPCYCSRKELSARAGSSAHDPEGQPIYDGYCRGLSEAETARRQNRGEPCAMRLAMDWASQNVSYHEAAPWGDVVLVRKDILTSYHIAVVADDALQGVTHVVRGQDLEAATPIHILLQKILGLPTPDYRHHRLIKNVEGEKLSKSAGSRSLRSLREAGVSAKEIRAALGFS